MIAVLKGFENNVYDVSRPSGKLIRVFSLNGPSVNPGLLLVDKGEKIETMRNAPLRKCITKKIKYAKKTVIFYHDSGFRTMNNPFFPKWLQFFRALQSVNSTMIKI